MRTDELTDRMHDAEDRAVVRFVRTKPYRTIEVESRSKVRQVIRAARDLAEEFLYARAEPEPAYATIQNCTHEREIPGTYLLNFQERLIEALYGNKRA